jgi:hypothetical protein
MSFDEHDGHDRPRAFVSVREPRYVGVCPGHEGTGPWGPATPFVPDPQSIERMKWFALQAQLDPSAAEPESLDAASEAEADIDSWFGHAPSDGAQWQVWATSELALAALRGVARECPGLRYHVVVSAQSDERRACALARRFAAHDDRFAAIDEQHVVLSTGDIEDVAFLAGYPLRGALSPFVTVLARSAGCAAVLYFDWDHDRFYFVETGDVVLRHVLWAASELGLDIVDDDGDIFMMSGAREYLAELRAWIVSGSKALPEALL